MRKKSSDSKNKKAPVSKGKTASKGKAADKTGYTGKNQAPKYADKKGVVSKNAKRTDVKNPEALAAFLGRKKLGGAEMAKRAAQGRKNARKGK